MKGAGLNSEELKYVVDFSAETSQPGEFANGSKIKHYWAKVLQKSKVGELITTDDLPALEALEDIRFTLEGTNTVKLTF